MTNGNGDSHLQKNKYKFLFVSWEASSGDLAWKIKNEGHDVKCYIEDTTDEYDGFLEKIGDWNNQFKIPEYAKHLKRKTPELTESEKETLKKYTVMKNKLLGGTEIPQLN